MSTVRFTEKFKFEAVKQVTKYKRPAAKVAQRLSVSTHCMYVWFRRYGRPVEQRQQESNETAKLRRLRAKIKCLTEVRDIYKKLLRTLPKSQAEVRVYPAAFDSLCSAPTLPGARDSRWWVLRLATPP